MKGKHGNSNAGIEYKILNVYLLNEELIKRTLVFPVPTVFVVILLHYTAQTILNKCDIANKHAVNVS